MEEKDRLIKLCFKALEKHFLDEFSFHITPHLTRLTRGNNANLSVIYFEVNELKGWLFGVYLREYDSYQNALKGDIFCQYKTFIDKFTPYSSTFEASIDFIFDQEGATRVSTSFDEDIRFIYKEPSLAKARDLYKRDYKEEHHTRVEAFFKVNAYLFKLNIERRLKKTISMRYVRKFHALSAPYFERVAILPLAAHVSRSKTLEGIKSFEELSKMDEYKELIKKLRKLNLKVARTTRALRKLGIEVYINQISRLVFDLECNRSDETHVWWGHIKSIRNGIVEFDEEVKK